MRIDEQGQQCISAAQSYGCVSTANDGNCPLLLAGLLVRVQPGEHYRQ
jgi:hypothetical protein